MIDLLGKKKANLTENMPVSAQYLYHSENKDFYGQEKSVSSFFALRVDETGHEIGTNGDNPMARSGSKKHSLDKTRPSSPG
jgi:hypothetical protein